MSELPLDIDPVFYVVVGVVGFTGFLTGDMVVRVGLVPTLLAILACLVAACVLLRVAPGEIVAAGVSAALYGVGVMAMSSLLVLWSSLVFPEQPSTGFSVTLFLFGVGCVAGPAALGALGDRFGLAAAFLVAAGITTLTAGVVRFPRQGRAGAGG